MPHKYNADRRHHIPRACYKVTNWKAYEAGLRQRGSLTIWFSEEAVAAWQAVARTTPGGQARYSDLAIETALILRTVFHQPLRQTEGLVSSLLGLMGLDLPVPDHSTLTSKEVDDAAELSALLDQIDEPLAAVIADGSYDQDRVYDDVAGHSAEAAVVVPPRSTAVLSPSAETDPTQRDRHIQVIAERGRMGWQRTSGYNARA